MTLLTLMSAKGSPGVTTTALAFAAAARTTGGLYGDDRVLLVEADPVGGDLECWCGPHGEPGLLRAVTDVRDGAGAERLRGHAVEVVPGVEALLAPTTATSVAAVWRSADGAFPEAFDRLGGTTIVDRGRAGVATDVVGGDRLVALAGLVVVVCRPTLGSVEHARALVSKLRSERRQVVAIVVGGDRPYGPEEIASALRVPVAGVLPWDPRGVVSLVEGGVGRAWLRSSLGLATQELLPALSRFVTVPSREWARG